MIPARYQIHRQMLNYLQYILTQPSNSLMARVFVAQQNTPTKGDWVSNITKLLNDYNMTISFLEVKNMKEGLYKSLVKRKVHEKAFKDLIHKKNMGQKGKNINYEKLEMAHYLLAKSKNSVQEKVEIFAYRCEMNNLPFNFGKKTNCEQGCPTEMNNEHLLNCPKLNQHKEKTDINLILNGTNIEKLNTLKKLNKNSTIRTQLLMDSV